MTVLGVVFPPDLPPEQLHQVALTAEEAGLEQLWLWEDCFAESGVATAAAVLAWTQRLTVGIGLLPVPLRNVALTAMELATLERLFPGRTVPGVGHGVLDWMAQVGARAQSPMTLLREYASALRALLHGERVSVQGRYVQLHDVALAWAPNPPPPLLIGAVGAKTCALAGELSDGVILTSEATNSVDLTRAAVQAFRAGRDSSALSGAVQVVGFIPTDAAESAEQLAERINGLASAGLTHAIVLATGDTRPLPDFIHFVAEEVRPLVR